MTQAGRPIDGVLTAENYQVALRQLEEQSLVPVKVSEGAAASAGGGVGARTRVRSHHVTSFYRQLGDLLKAGVPMMRSLDVLAKQSGQGRLPQVILELREDVSGGMSLGEALVKHPGVFSPLHASMISAGEQGGFLEEVLERIAIFSEKQDELRNKLIGSMIYPSMLVVAGFAIVSLIMLVVVPSLRQHLREENFNILTKVVFGVTDFLKAHVLTVLLGVGVLGGLFFAWKRTDSGRRSIQFAQLRAPVLGKVFTMVSICRFCRILGTLLHNGVPILQALKISRDSAGNEILGEVVEKARDAVKKGEALSAPLAACGMFPPAVVDMIAVAEESNNLEKVLIQIAETNEARTARQIDLAVRVIEPVLLMVMACVVLVIAVALILPILTMGSGAGR